MIFTAKPSAIVLFTCQPFPDGCAIYITGFIRHIVCSMPDEACDGRNVALKWQLEVKSHLLACLIVQNNHPTINSSTPNNIHAKTKPCWRTGPSQSRNPLSVMGITPYVADNIWARAKELQNGWNIVDAPGAYTAEPESWMVASSSGQKPHYV